MTVSGCRACARASLLPEHAEALEDEPSRPERDQPAAVLVLGRPRATRSAARRPTSYLILDEAHRGMKRAADRQDDRARAHPRAKAGSNPAVPIVWGISATIERFTKAMGEAKDRTGLSERRRRHRASPGVGTRQGRDRPRPTRREGYVLDDAAARGGESDTRFRAALGGVLRGRRGAEGAAGAGGPGARQGRRRPKIGELVKSVEAEWPGLGPNAIAHVFGEHEPIVLGSRTIAGCIRSRSRPRPTSGWCSLRRRSRRAGTARGRRSSIPSGPPRTRRTSPRSSGGWSASRWPTASPPTTR